MHSPVWWSVCVLLVLSTAFDLASRRIPNFLVGPFLIAGVVFSAVEKHWPGVYSSLEGIGVSLLVFGFLCFLRGMGMGDLKLCMAIGAWIGPSQMITAIVVTFIAGGVMAVIWSLATGTLDKSLSGAGRLLAAFGTQGVKPIAEFSLANKAARKMPYAPAIAFGTFFSFLTVVS